MNTSIEQRYQALDAAIKKQAAALGQTAPTLLAVSKTQAAPALRAAYSLGVRDFGENYLQEALEKQESLHDLGINWHFIGALQSNKCKDIAQHFSWVHSVASQKHAKRLNDARQQTGLTPLNVCIQVNIDAEESKAGVTPEACLELAEAIDALPSLTLRGLMSIPKANSSDAQRAQSFADMQSLQASLQQKFTTVDTLSMGMSGDFPAAMAAGSTMLRIGTALFGPRAAKL